VSNSKKILIVSSLPVSYPPKDGYSMVIFYRSYFLKKIANIESDIIVPENEKNPAKNLIESGIFDNVFSYPINNKWISLIKSFFLNKTHTMIRHDIKYKYQKRILIQINKNKYEAVIFDFSASYPLYEKLVRHINVRSDNIIYWSHNIDYIYFKALANETKNLLEKFFYFFIYKNLEKIEPSYIKKFPKIVSVSHHEIKILKEINPKALIYWIPPMLPEQKTTEIEKKYVSAIIKKVEKYEYKILFSGVLRIPSNVLAVIWFANKIFPIIKSKLNACFMIVGRDPSKDIINLVNHNKDIFLFPNVPSLAPFYEISDLVVIPLFNPAGIKLKLMEALKYRKKVVARPEALLGAGLEKIVPNATEPEDFAEKCIRSLKDEIDFSIIWDKFNEIYNEEKIINKLKDILFNKINYENS